MRCIKFMYEKDGGFSERLGLEFGPALRGEGNVAVYQIEPEAGFKTFKGAKMRDIRSAVNPWQTETYARRLARLREPLFHRTEVFTLALGIWCIIWAFVGWNIQ